MQDKTLAPPFLRKGDKIAITCPAKKLPGTIDSAVKLLRSWDLEVILGETVQASHHQYAGSDELRRRDLQSFLDDKTIKAIIAARGGYGTIRIIDDLNFWNFKQNPKWLVGFSDITILHSHINETCRIQTIHGQMPLNIPDGTKPSLESLRKALFGEQLGYEIVSNPLNRCGTTEGELIGGNLTLLVMMNNSISEMEYTGKILFIEDVGEYMYSIDRMLWNLRRGGQLARLKGLIVGGFTDLKDNDIPFGSSLEQIVLEHVKDYEYPVCFDFPAGHLADNHALVLGKVVTLSVEPEKTKLSFA
ncbi:LD-carboxypeptidase [Paradesertivirga mongoliensis]|uniref:LD-carboxypeptidase n=1 Tax=Paradesertivirga mongoliensis TaxID=2100740 RepID=A0ABW4ZI35_9SPHI|nr:LD-carboxypeptidase [Pedobacter mongoliensis]